MIAHILNAGIRALAASVILGGALIYAVGGVNSPDARAVAIATIGGFFVFWLVFIFMFGRRVPAPERGSRHEAEGKGTWSAGHRRNDESAEGGDGGGGDGGDQ